MCAKDGEKELRRREIDREESKLTNFFVSFLSTRFCFTPAWFFLSVYGYCFRFIWVQFIFLRFICFQKKKKKQLSFKLTPKRSVIIYFVAGFLLAFYTISWMRCTTSGEMFEQRSRFDFHIFLRTAFYECNGQIVSRLKWNVKIQLPTEEESVAAAQHQWDGRWVWRNEFHAKDYLNKNHTAHKNRPMEYWHCAVNTTAAATISEPRKQTKNNQSLERRKVWVSLLLLCKRTRTHIRSDSFICTTPIFPAKSCIILLSNPISKCWFQFLFRRLLFARVLKIVKQRRGIPKWNAAKCKRDMLLVFAHIILTFNKYYLNKRLLLKISGMLSNCCCFCCCFVLNGGELRMRFSVTQCFDVRMPEVRSMQSNGSMSAKRWQKECLYGITWCTIAFLLTCIRTFYLLSCAFAGMSTAWLLFWCALNR